MDVCGVLIRYYLIYRLFIVFFQSLQYCMIIGNVYVFFIVDYFLYLYVGFMFIFMKIEIVLLLFIVYYCMKVICEKCLY